VKREVHCPSEERSERRGSNLERVKREMHCPEVLRSWIMYWWEKLVCAQVTGLR